MNQLSAFALLALALVACDSSKSAGTAASASAPAGSAQAAPSAAATAAPSALKLDPEAQKLLAAVVANCEIDPERAEVKNCKNKEEEAIGHYASEKKPPNLLETLAEMAVTDGAKDPKMLAAACNMMPRTLNLGGYEWFKTNATRAAGERLVKLAATAPDGFEYILPESLVAGAIYAGMQSELTAALKKRDPKSSIVRSAVYHYVQYGGPGAFADLEELGKSPEDGVRYGAMAAAGVAVQGDMFFARPKFEGELMTKVCDWAKGHLLDEDDARANGAADSMSRCKGAYIDAALDAVIARAGKKPSYGLSQTPHHLCWSEGIIGGVVNGTPEQCAKALEATDKLLANPDLEGENLRVAVWGIASIGKNGKQQKKARELLQKLTSHKNKTAADAAKEGLKDLDKK